MNNFILYFVTDEKILFTLKKKKKDWEILCKICSDDLCKCIDILM